MRLKITKPNIRMAKETLNTDATLEAIGQQYGVSRACVWQNLKRLKDQKKETQESDG